MATTLEKPGSFSSLPWSALETAIGGDMLLPENPRYDEARRVWNGMIDRRPAAIARARTTDDVAAAVRFARDHGLEIAVRGGGHSWPGKSVCDDGIMIDLSHMNEAGFNDVAKLSTAPLIATHCNVHALCPASRNLTDRQFAQIKESNGMVGLNFSTSFLRADGMGLAEMGWDFLDRLHVTSRQRIDAADKAVADRLANQQGTSAAHAKSVAGKLESIKAKMEENKSPAKDLKQLLALLADAHAGGPPLLAVSILGMYATIPETGQILPVAVVAVPIALVGGPARLARLGTAGAAASVVLLVAVVAEGGQARPASIVGGLASFGVLALEPMARRVAPATAAPPDRWASGAMAVLVAVHVVVVAVASRIAGLRGSGAEALVIVAAAAALGLAALGRHMEHRTRHD